jgi:hypothetical protein
MAGGKLSDADRLQPLTAILGMPRPPAKMARLRGGSGLVDHMVEEISDSIARQRSRQPSATRARPRSRVRFQKPMASLRRTSQELIDTHRAP